MVEDLEESLDPFKLTIPDIFILGRPLRHIPKILKEDHLAANIGDIAYSGLILGMQVFVYGIAGYGLYTLFN